MEGNTVRCTGGETLKGTIHGAAFRELNVSASVKLTSPCCIVSVVWYEGMLRSAGLDRNAEEEVVVYFTALPGVCIEGR
jgi:hypothetical protein